jgi:hypothetical protein
MQTMSILYMAPTHVVWNLQYSTKWLVKQGFLLAGRKKPVSTHYGWVAVIF